MAFPTTSVLDDFNRADNASSLGANWAAGVESGYSSLGVLSNQAYANGGFQGNYWSASIFGADQESYATLPVVPVYRFRLYVRLTDPGGSFNAYSVNVLNTGIIEDAIATVAGTGTYLTPTGGIGGTFVAGDSIGMSVIGTTLSIWLKHAGVWTEIVTYTDGSVTGAGYIGMHVGDETTVRIDDFGGGTIPITLSNTFETALADETDIIEANSDDGTAGDIFDGVDEGSGTLKFDTLRAAHGTYSAKITNGTGRNGVRWSAASMGTQTEVYGRVYVYRTAQPVTQHMWLIRCEGTSGSGLNAIVYWATDGNLGVWDQPFNSAGAGITLPLNTWVRIEFKLIVDDGAGIIEAKAFSGDSTTVLGTATLSSATTGTDCEAVTYGDTNDTPGTATFWIDSLNVNNTDYPGPAAVAVEPQTFYAYRRRSYR